MIQIDTTLAQLLQSVEQNGLCVEKEVHPSTTTGVDEVFPHVIIIMCMSGTTLWNTDLVLQCLKFRNILYSC